ncbi:MAG: phage major capsid protein [Cetobacterium sp.]
MPKMVDVKIKFISLVTKGANRKKFCIVKSDNEVIELNTFILKQDEEKRLVTSVVYEPDVKDTQGDYMTSEDVEKMAHEFMSKYGQGVDLQHDEKIIKADVVESWITKTETIIGGQKVSKGAWVATVKVNDDEVWEAIKKGRITGFSMGGSATKIEKSENKEEQMEEIKKMIEELISKGVDKNAINDVMVRIVKAEEAIAKMSNESEEIKKSKTEEITALKETVAKMDEALKSYTAPIGKEETIEKSETTYNENLRKSDLSTGASLIPKTLSSQIVKDMKEISPFFADGAKISATGTTIRVPVRMANTESSAIGKEEGKVTTAGKTNFTEVEISKGTIQSVIPITDELRRDSQFNVAGLVREYGAEDIAEIIAINSVSGVLDVKFNKIEGFTNHADFKLRVTAPATVGKITLDDLAKVKKEVKPQYIKGAKWYVSKDAYYAMKTMKDTQGRPLWIESLIAGAPSTFDGHPVVLAWQMDDKFPVLFANFGKLYMYFMDYSLESEVDRQALAGYNNEILRARLGGKVVNPQAGYMLSGAPAIVK